MKIIIKFFDHLEDRVRTRLSSYPLIYAFIGAVGIVLFWRGVWHIADDIGLSSINSLIVSVIILLSTGLFVSFFVGENIILTGLKHEKKLAEKTESEIKTEGDNLRKLIDSVDELRRDVSKIESLLKSKDVK